MAEIQIQIDTAELEEKAKALSHIPDGAPKAIMRALNRVLPGMATDGAKEVSARYIVKQKDVKNHLIKQKASVSNLSIVMRSKGRPMRLVKFRTKPNKRPGVKGSPTAFAQVKKSSGGARIPGAFMANFSAGAGTHGGIFVRDGNFRTTSTGTLREGIRQLHGPGSVQMLDNPEIREIIQKRATERFNVRIDHEINYLLDRVGG